MVRLENIYGQTGDYKNMVQYEIFTIKNNGDTKSAAIDDLMGYPTPNGKTERYRDLIKHNTQDLWAGIITDKLVHICSSMTSEQRAFMYDELDLKDTEYLKDNNWFPDIEV